MLSIDGASRIPCLPDEIRWMFEEWVLKHFPEIPDDPDGTCLARGLFVMGDLESVSRGLGHDWREVLDGRFLNAFSLSALDEHVEGVEVEQRFTIYSVSYKNQWRNSSSRPGITAHRCEPLEGA